MPDNRPNKNFRIIGEKNTRSCGIYFFSHNIDNLKEGSPRISGGHLSRSIHTIDRRCRCNEQDIAYLVARGRVFLGVAFLSAVFFFGAAFFGAAFLAVVFLAVAFFGAAFLAVVFLAVAFFAVAFFGAAFLAVAFFATAFFGAQGVLGLQAILEFLSIC